ncbi:Dyp-type peroxidase, partial [Salmonella enterica subsp. enterica]|nr:Dyp-type peroxidase [Salmonella enterica subsp. enterica serovar Enteritidis]
SALGPGGLTALGLPAEPGRDALASFPLAFRQGMADQYRSRVLDDVGASDPQVWRWGAQDNPVDVVLVSYADTEARLDAKLKRLDKVLRASGAKRVVRLSLTTNRQDKGAEDVASEAPVKRERSEQQPREHFGFADGISQPVIRGVRHRRTHNSSPMHSIAAGEFIFGYRDEHGCFPPPPTVPSRFDQSGRLPAVDVSGAPSADRHAVRDFGRNGTFAVIRQLEQHVDAFNDYCQSRGDALGKTPEWVGSRIIGRWPNGSSVVRNPESAGSSLDNAFSYGEEDPQGRHCPLGAHVRRSNPRDSLGLDLDAQLRISKRHRILRAGRSYVDGKEKGLLFVCFNASIERQYEFIQQTWMSGMNFHGLRGEKDPLIGNHSQYAGRLTIQKWEGADELKRIPAFVTTRGGGYYFVPGQTALRFLRHRLAAQSLTPASASATPVRSRVSADPA